MKPIFKAVAITLALVGGTALAQALVVERGVYSLRANALPSDRLPASSASQHDIEPAADRGVLNVVVLERRDGRQRTVSARVDAARQNLLGQKVPRCARSRRTAACRTSAPSSSAVA